MDDRQHFTIPKVTGLLSALERDGRNFPGFSSHAIRFLDNKRAGYDCAMSSRLTRMTKYLLILQNLWMGFGPNRIVNLRSSGPNVQDHLVLHDANIR